MTFKTRINGSTRDFIYQTLREQIINLELKPGTKISEKEIAEKFKVSRTPVRESFLKLAQEELLEIYPQSGTIISRIDLDHVEEARFTREMIERGIVRIACGEFPEELLFQLESNITMQELCVEKGNHQRLFELDEEFHKTLFYGCKKNRTWEMIRQMNCHFDRIRMLRLASNTDWRVVISQHKEIFDLIIKKDPDKAEKAMMNHLKLVILEKEELQIRYPDYFK
ncbi:GntR family transcriptional regulator [Paenactinomyces guangxiensis]|uniref:GntR family transcriptional regulator n=1 Tax=Paenactinomyces guangxiensis TaxID=1490290 RepID=UPI001E2AD76B|nr:GntR family transcriptional regulator [Paenactinomyces guangxiensis]